MQCPRCHAPLRPGVRFCEECGVPAPLVCPSCGAEVVPEKRFCGSCGAPVAAPPGARFVSPQSYTPKHLAEKILKTRAAFEGERKQVTVLFSDVSGFTAISERLDPEDVHAMMDRAFEATLDAVHRYEGTVNQFLGDGVMALFGAPIAHEDHAHRALRAALAVQEGLQPLHDDVRRTYGLEFQVRVGINTGLVVVGAIGKDLRMDYTAVGDTTNLAFRLLGLAQPGQIVISGHTQHLTEGFFTFEDLGEFSVKGKAEPVRAYAVKSEIQGRTRLEVSRERGLTPLVGREAEVRQLAEGYGRAADGRGAIVLVRGDPGIGKSRLLYEFLRRLDRTRVRELEATCVSYGRSMPYRPILELLGRYLGLWEGMPEQATRTRIAACLRSLGVEGEEPAILLAHFVGASAPSEFLIRLESAQLKERTFGILRTLFLRASEMTSLVIVVENLHWLDPSSEEFLGYLAEGLSGHRILLLLTTRPGFAAPWLALAETIALEGLDTGGAHAMTRALLGAERVSEPLLQVVLAKGEGNPLYVEEILRQLQETDGIIIENGEARLRGTHVAVPETIHDIIAARIDRLAEPVKHTLQVAAVVGRRFGVSLLSRVLEIDGRVEDRLRDLHQLDFVFPIPEEPELMYSFKHALTQEVAYASLLERRRRIYHTAVGVALEELHAGRTDEVVELLAHHFGQSAEAEKAVDYAIGAAEKAQRRWANIEALAHFEAALKRLDAMPDTEPNRLRRLDAVLKQSEVKFAQGRHAEQVQALETIRGLVEGTGDPRRRAAWYYWTGYLHTLTGARLELPLAYCREASTIADAAGLDEIRAFAECCLAHVYAQAGDPSAAVAAGERALAIFQARGNVWWACRTLWILSMASISLGEWTRSGEYCHRALQYGQEVNDLRLKVVGWWRTGSTHIQRGDTETGLRCCEEALALSPTPFDAAMIKAVQGYGLVKAGQVAAGTAQLAEAVAWLDQSHLRYTRSVFAVRLAEGYLLQGDRLRARQVLEEVLATSREVGYRQPEGMAHRLLGQSFTPDDPRAAAEHLERATGILEEVGARNELAKALVAQADLHRATGDTRLARQLLERAFALFETLGTLDEPSRVRAALAALPDSSPA
ncbi:MAG: AAA family ATPase [Candidatus Rokubacteria bacterium]|nr:AAA family ATPase [Candidatus Rokubacteria bacterium]